MITLYRIMLLLIISSSHYCWSNNFYWSVSVGHKYAEFSELNERGDSAIAKPSLGWQYKDYFIIDLAGFLDSASVSLGNDGIRLTGGQLAVKAALPVNDHWFIYAKTGWFEWESKIRPEDGGGSRSDSGGDIFFGAGISYKLGRRFFIFLEYDSYDDLDGVDSRVTSFGFGRSF